MLFSIYILAYVCSCFAGAFISGKDGQAFRGRDEVCGVIVWLDCHTSIHVDASCTDGIQTFTLEAFETLEIRIT